MPLLILTFNVILMVFFCCACQLVVTPAYNQFVQYGNTGDSLPFLTQFIVDSRYFFFLIPILWVGLSFKVHSIIKKKDIAKQTQILLFCSLVTISIGLVMVSLFALSGILPYLMISTAV